MNKANYTKAKNYAFRAGRNDYVDVVHDAYIIWFDKTGKDLFDEPNRTMISVIRNTIMSKNQKKYFMYDGAQYKKKIMAEGDWETVLHKSVFVENQTPEDIVEEILIRERLEASLTVKQKPYYDLMAQGYSLKEIAQELHGSQQLASFYRQQIRKHLN
jgi:DNA-binding NarL/FixJ family response regulator